MPGAELLVGRDNRFVGAIKIKVGPVTVSYKGTITLTEIDEAAHVARMIGEGRETAGAGSARVTMVSRVTPVDGGSEVIVDADVDLVGKIVQFGRGMIEEVSKQLFQQFSQCAKSQLEVESNTSPPGNSSPEEAKPVSAIPLAFRAGWAILTRALRRLFGMQSPS
jgi:carbon monoxide dehydrogenase subunit G